MSKSHSIILYTSRLELVAATLDHVCAELEGTDRLALLLDALVESGWPPGEYDRDAQEFFRDRLQEGGAAAVGWYGWYAIRRASTDQPALVIGAGGYFGPPNEAGEVEIGFSMMPAWEGYGFATELAEALVRHALDDIRICRVIAHTAPNNHASRKVLAKCGFDLVGRDQESGNDLFEIVRSERR